MESYLTFPIRNADLFVASYELLKWDEHLQKQRGKPQRRDLEWATIAREIALMNKPYSRQS